MSDIEKYSDATFESIKHTNATVRNIGWPVSCKRYWNIPSGGVFLK